MQQVAGQRIDLALGNHPLVHRIVGPAGDTAVEETQAPVRIAFAVPQVAAHEAVAASEAIGAESSRRDA